MPILLQEKEKKKKRKDSAGSGDTASMIKGGAYLGARTRRDYTICVLFLAFL
jgi:hypothetical protein